MYNSELEAFKSFIPQQQIPVERSKIHKSNTKYILSKIKLFEFETST